jgi:UDP-N-acetylmuramoyl-L-alanyl-D-glutamate--2,6-diaminopimelate ligase
MGASPPPISLSALIKGIEGASILGREDPLVRGVAYHSAAVSPGDLFICVRGGWDDGHRHARDAVARRAVALAVEHRLEGLDGVAQVQVTDGRRALSALAARFYGSPSSRLRVVGITGTEGKTTTAFLVDSILRAAGRRTGMFGTIVNRIGTIERRTEYTTPEAPDLQRLLWQCAESGVTDVVMEVSSHALAQGRVADCEFDLAVLTNLHSDHLDFHQTHDAYREAKLQLFTGLGGGPAKRGQGAGVVNGDDQHADEFVCATSRPVRTFGLRTPAHVVGRPLVAGVRRTVFWARTARWTGQISLRLTGHFNVSNALAAIAVAEWLQVPPGEILAGLEQLRGVPGRFEVVPNRSGLLIVIDFAHTEAAFGEVLPTLRSLAPGRVVTVFGCAGDRDRTKRGAIGRLVTRLSDLAIITTDNPAHEDPAEIAREVITGAREVDPAGERHRVVLDRFVAVEMAMALARTGDAVLLAGKGHEECQIVDGSRVPYSDRWAVREVLTRRGARMD